MQQIDPDDIDPEDIVDLILSDDDDDDDEPRAKGNLGSFYFP